MSKKRNKQELLPWNNTELEVMLTGLIAHGTEVSKIDFKAEIETGTAEQKAELLKDITAIANTYDDENYEDHGFIIYGVKAKIITGISQTESDTDKFQNNIEQILRTYISPMPKIYAIGFETIDGKKWGAIVIPPRNNKPHMFFKDLSCQNPTKSRKKGEWFVRRGSTTDPGLPEDLLLISQKQTELLLEPIRESVRNLQSRVSKTEEQYNSALFKLVERALSALPEAENKTTEKNIELSDNIGEALGMDLATRLKQKLKTPRDAMAEDLISEAKNIKDFLDGSNTGLTWVPQANNPEENKIMIEDLEERVKLLQVSLAMIALKDKSGTYTDALIRSVKILAKVPEVPSGISYNRLGEAIRYYPLGILLYTIFICCVAEGREDIIKKVLEIPLKNQKYKTVSSITDIFFFWYEARALLNNAFNQRWCEPMGMRIRQLVNDRIGEMMTEISESEYFFRGEFVLALATLDYNKGIKLSLDGEVEDKVPLPGLYLYMHEAEETIKGLLVENPDWLNKIYTHPLENILEVFDKNAHKVVSSGCIGLGINGLKTKETYKTSLSRKINK